VCAPSRIIRGAFILMAKLQQAGEMHVIKQELTDTLRLAQEVARRACGNGRTAGVNMKGPIGRLRL